MKKSILVFAASVMTFTAALAAQSISAAESGFTLIKDASVFPLLYKANTSSDITVSLIEENEKRILAEVLKRMGGFNNLNNFSTGQNLSGVNNGILFLPEKKNDVAFHVERVHGADDKVLLMVGKSSRGFTVHFEDKNGRKLYSETKIVKRDFARVYNFSKVKGEVSLVVTDFHGNEMKFDF